MLYANQDTKLDEIMCALLPAGDLQCLLLVLQV